MSVRRYTMGAGSIDALAHRLDEEFAPALAQEPGFRGYFVVETEDRTLETISVFTEEAAARRSGRLAENYVAENLAEFELTRIEQIVGEVLAGRTAPGILEPVQRWRSGRARERAEQRGAPVLVIGATGRTGQHIVERLVDRGLAVRALARDPERARRLLPAVVQRFVGDVRHEETLAPAMKGCAAVIVCMAGGSAHADSAVFVDYYGTENVVRAASRTGVDLLLYVSSIYASRPDYYQDVEPFSLGWKARGEELVRASGIPYSIVRAGWLTDAPGGEPLALSQGDECEGHLTRQDLAAVCAELLFLEEARGKTFEVVASRDGAPPLHEAIAALLPDVGTRSSALSSA